MFEPHVFPYKVVKSIKNDESANIYIMDFTEDKNLEFYKEDK